MDYSKLNDILSKGSKKTLFYVAVVPVNPMGEVLVAERKEDGIWTTPAGGQEGDETPEQTAIRECWEEAGIACIASMLEPLGVKAAPNGKPVHCFLLRTNQTQFSTKLDPDREVHSWAWYSREKLPEGLSRQKNANRLETISQALMKFYGLVKADHDVLSLIEKLDKGGAGSGVKGHQTAEHVAAHSSKLDAAMKREEVATRRLKMLTSDPKCDYNGKTYDTAAKEYHASVRDRQKAVREGKAIVDAHKLNKGGEGSGKVGHMTAKKPSLHAVAQTAQQVPPINKVQAHLDLLQNGGTLPGVHTKSGKPIVLDPEQARAQGYTTDDYADAVNVHYNMAQKVNGMVEKLKMAGKKAPPEAIKIAKIHEKQMKLNMKARDHLEQRQKDVKAAAHNHVKKSQTQMGGGLGDRDLDIGEFAQTVGNTNGEWMERLHTAMINTQFGDMPEAIQLPKGLLHLAKVDDGLYSGVYTKQELVGDGMLQDNAKVRIERQTIPELVTFMMAQEWIVDHLKAEPEAPKQSSDEVGLQYAAEMNSAADDIALQEKLSSPSPTISMRQFEDNEQRIRMLELITKLLG